MTFFLKIHRICILDRGVLLSVLLFFGSVTSAFTQSEQDVKIASVQAEEPLEESLDPAVLAMQEVLERFHKAGRGELNLQVRAGISAFYQQNGYEKLWLEDGKFTSKARSLIFKIGRAAEYGLNPSDYDLPRLGLGQDETLSSLDLLRADLQMSLSVARYVQHLAAGRLVPQAISESLDLNPERPDSAVILAELSGAADPIGKLDGFHPQHPQYKALLKQLATLRMEKAQKPILIPQGKLLRPGMEDARMPLLRARLKVELPPRPASVETGDTAPANKMAYDEDLVAAVKAFQGENGLARDGIIGPRTLRALNGTAKSNPVHQVLANLERWRWMPRELGPFHIFVNIPEFSVFVIRDQEAVHSTRVVVGKTANKTVAFSDEMEKFVVNPVWGVPKSIVSKEMLPAARANPTYFSRRGYQVFAHIRGRTRQVDTSRVDWNLVRASQISVRQPPGARNALGRIKFLFPNEHLIYMHDTPSKSLFKRNVRAFSHGCVRVQNPLEFADAILANEPEWDAERIRKMIGGRENTVELVQHIPVHIAYFTMKINDENEMVIFRDIYGHDKRIIKALGL